MTEDLRVKIRLNRMFREPNFVKIRQIAAAIHEDCQDIISFLEKYPGGQGWRLDYLDNTLYLLKMVDPHAKDYMEDGLDYYWPEVANCIQIINSFNFKWDTDNPTVSLTFARAKTAWDSDL